MVTVAALIFAALALVLALVCLTAGVLGTVSRLPRNRWLGVRSAETLQSDEAFVLANRVAGPGVICAGVVLTMGAALAAALGGGVGLIVALAAITVGIGIAGVVGSLAIRAAAAAAPDPASDCGVSGGCTSCSLQSMCVTEDSAAGPKA
ncbi:SdpI/YhfL family protein [Williamsia limnetica]|uniref:SdpI/YhfL family protein n=1 Tax=Williamsia limnetica TaxID=882452 RepID=A0A318RQM1_WILLI|nr:SdpI/YhfL family protein [Williamsia limnetica]